MESIKSKTTKGIVWSSVEHFSVQGVQFLFMLVMARLLTPDDYGLIGMLSIFLAVAQSLVNSGFSQALIRKQNRTEVDNSTVFYFNIVVSVFLYLIFFFSAPLVADFYESPELMPIMRLVSISIIINSFVVVQRAQFTIRVDFKNQAKASLLAAIISGFLGVIFAILGYGYWALVIQILVSAAINAIVLWIISSWRPMLTYSWRSFKDLFSFGSKLLASGLIDTIYCNINPLVIGKFFPVAMLGYYSRAKGYADMPSSHMTGVIQRVTYPILCSIQNNDERLADVYRRFLKLSAYVIFPIMIGLSALAHPLVCVMIGEKWDYAATLLQIICFSMMWYPVHSLNINLLQVKGRSDWILKLEIIKKTIGVIILCITVPIGLEAMCYGGICSSILCLLVNTYYTGKLINVGFIRQMRDLFPTFLICIVMFVAIILCNQFVKNYLIQILIGLILGCVIFLGSSYVFKFRELQELKTIISRKNKNDRE